ncbi:MAG: helix-turn-helix transcriptional regulator [Clostridia bacterium]|nr:helix-turn-helix transcriptional regulator [Clostridia bacterium]
MNEYVIYSNRHSNDFSVTAACLDIFENIEFLHKSRNIAIGASYSEYCHPCKIAFMTISYSYIGETVYTVNGNSYCVKPGEFMIYGRGCTTMQTAAPGGSVTYSFSVSPQFCKNHNICDDMIYHVKSDERLKNLFLKFFGKYDKNPTDNSTITAALQMLIHTTHNYKQYSAGTPDSGVLSDNQMIRIVKYINRNLFNKIHLDDMAKVLGLNPMYFCRIFKKTCGYSPVAYANFLRCRNARQLLLTTDFTPKEIIEACGFYSMSQFKNMYKKLTGRDAELDAATPPVVINMK